MATPDTGGYVTVQTDDGFSVSSNTQTEEQIREAFAPEPKESEPAAPVEKPVEPEPVEEPAAEDKPPKIDRRTREGRKLSIQEEIDALTATKHNTRREIEQAQAELADLRRQQAELSRPAPKSDAPQPASPAPAAGTPAYRRYTAMPDAPKLAEFETYDEWNAALALFIADKRYDERREAEKQEDAQRQQTEHFRERDRKHEERLAKARAADPTFDSRVKLDTPVSAPMRDIIRESDVGPELILYLSEHHDDAQRISTLHPIQAIREMGILEGTLKARLTAAQSGPAREESPVSHAKPPIKPVGSSPVVSGDDLDTSDDNLSLDEHIRRENLKERRAARR